MQQQQQINPKFVQNLPPNFGMNINPQAMFNFNLPNMNNGNPSILNYLNVMNDRQPRSEDAMPEIKQFFNPQMRYPY